jgi:hypothetical protein
MALRSRSIQWTTRHVKHVPVRIQRGSPDGINGLVDLVDWAHPTVPGACANVGAYAGETAAILSETGLFDVIYCIDAYRSPGDGLAERYFRVRQHYRPNLWLMRMSSTRAALSLQDGSLDLVYLEDITEHRQITRDIRAWLPKLRPRGVIAGRGWTQAPTSGQTQLEETLDTETVQAAVRHALGEPDETFFDGSWACRI